MCVFREFSDRLTHLCGRGLPSVAILEVFTATELNKVFFFGQIASLSDLLNPTLRKQTSSPSSGDIALMMEMVLVFETLEFVNHPTRLSAREVFTGTYPLLIL